MGAVLSAAVDKSDAEGEAAREASADFAKSLEHLDRLLAQDDEDDDVLRVCRTAGPPTTDTEELVARNLRRLESETAWQMGEVGLEIQRPWSRLLLTGEKAVETRSYPLPAGLIGKPLAVLETPEAQAGVSSLPDLIPAGDERVRIVGSVTFGSSIAYESYEAWSADEARHRVGSDSPYAWTKERPIHGWVVSSVTYEAGDGDGAEASAGAPAPELCRRHRSFFELCGELERLQKRLKRDLAIS
eukprot:TRINITY_DN65408_c0_g1_i1.p1 TRINITY_DN65408_c0_g1~~TRINITY_DN65408_c0_g1_i1.p1  ORF type:complete len:286 (+),score=55.06 TRINITY_DN65408_c0_g1_i1:127-858(+)